jgi:hypothetical protein
MAVGLPLKTTYADGDVYAASDVNDTNGTVNLIGQTTNFFAGKNKIINGDMSIWQRGTSYNATAVTSYGAADRYSYFQNGSTAGTNTISRETFTPGTAPVAGYESQYFQRWTATTLGTGQTAVVFNQAIENVQTFAGQTATVSYWAKSSAAFTTDVTFRQNFGSGGSASVDTTTSTSTTSTSWTRFTFTINVPSISGKTIGTSSHLVVGLRFYTITAGATVDIWGVQLEAGSTATAFQTATGTIQGELAACQRYWTQTYPFGTAANSATNAEGSAQSIAATTNSLFSWITYPVTMRTSPTINLYAGAGGSGAGSVRNNTAGPVVTGVSANTINTNGFTNIFKSLGFTAANIYGFEYTASAEL